MNQIMKLLNKLEERFTDTVTEMWIGELLFGIVCELVFVWFAKDRLTFSIGLWAGVILCMACTLHMQRTIYRSLDIADEKDAGKYIGSRYLIRYFALIILVVLLYFSGLGNAFAAFLGYMGMKPAAYIQPFIHKVIRR